MTAIEGAAKLTAMVIRLEKERDAAIERAEKAEAELANCRFDLATMENKVYQAEFALAEARKNSYLGACPFCGHPVEVFR